MSQKRSDDPNLIEYTRVKASFKLVFISGLAIVVFCLVISIIMGMQPTLTDSGKTVLESTLTISKVGTGAIFGLWGGRVLPQ